MRDHRNTLRGGMDNDRIVGELMRGFAYALGASLVYWIGIVLLENVVTHGLFEARWTKMFPGLVMLATAVIFITSTILLVFGMPLYWVLLRFGLANVVTVALAGAFGCYMMLWLTGTAGATEDWFIIAGGVVSALAGHYGVRTSRSRAPDLVATT